MAEKLGRYEILEQIGQGGFAIVHRGRDTTLDRLVALKELRSILLNDGDWVKRFRREARTIARLDHAHIVTIHDVYDAGERLCIVMRLVDGPSLEEFITANGPLPWADAVELITAVGKGLDYAHAQGILHRDLKPANILIDPERGPMLTDFGLAKLAGENSTSITAGGGVVGTPHYIAPEVWEGKGTTQQSDIYALGCILYEVLTGEKIFKGETPPAVMMAHFKPVALPDSWPAGVPPGVARVLRKALATNPASRYSTAGEMIDALNNLAATETEPDTGLLPQAPPKTDTVLENATSEPQPSPASEAPISEIVTPPGPTATAPQMAESVETPSGQAPVSPPAQPDLQPRKRRRGAGCWIALAAVLGFFIIAVVGVGGFCSTFGQEFAASFMEPIELGNTVEETIRIPMPDSAEPPNLTIDFAGGDLVIAPGAHEVLVEGSATYNAPQLKPIITTKNNEVHLHLSEDIGFGGFATDGLKNIWELMLGAVPMALIINAGGTDADIELGGLALENLTITQGAANFDLAFSEPNKTGMDKFSFTGGASSVRLTGLANATAKDMEFQAGAGDYTLEFTGLLQRDTDVVIKGGLGTVTVIIPENVDAELSVSDGPLSNINAAGAWQEVENRYFIPGEGHKINIVTEIGFGNLNLRTQ